MKGKIMTTENTTATTSAESNMTPYEFAEDFIKTHSVLEIAEQLVTYSESVDNLTTRVQAEAGNSKHYIERYNRLFERVEQFLKSHILEDDEASVDDMKEFAESIGIELTKTITVTFTAEVEVEITVPIDASIDDIDENDFTVSAEFDGKTDWEVEDTDITINDFNAEEE
jgi:hypothetical protein